MTRPSISMQDRLQTNYQWTERQRAVLALIVQGKSNTGIAEALGISLAGVKWHIGEILSKLQAESREEAAEYWRRYNGLAPRFARIFRGLATATALKWLAAGAVLALAGAAVAIAAVAAPGDGDRDNAPIEPVRAEAHDPDFVLALESPRSAWDANEPIEVRATLSYVGGTTTSFYGSGSGPPGFSFREVGGSRELFAVLTADCAPHSITSTSPLVVPYVKSGGISSGDPDEAFYRAFLADPFLRLPAGTWDISVHASFFMPPGCGLGRAVDLNATIRIIVE